MSYGLIGWDGRTVPASQESTSTIPGDSQII